MTSLDKLHETSKLHWTDFFGSWNCCTYASSVIRSIIIVRATNSILTFELITNFWFWQKSSNQLILCYFHSCIFPHIFFYYYWINHWFIFTSYLLLIFMSRFIIIIIFRLLFKIESCSRIFFWNNLSLSRDSVVTVSHHEGRCVFDPYLIPTH